MPHPLTTKPGAEIDAGQAMNADKPLVDVLGEALSRILEIEPRCDRSDDDIRPEDCPAIKAVGEMCHQCEGRAALSRYRAMKEAESGLVVALNRADKLIDWMSGYLGNMAPGPYHDCLADLNEHFLFMAARAKPKEGPNDG